MLCINGVSKEHCTICFVIYSNYKPSDIYFSVKFIDWPSYLLAPHAIQSLNDVLNEIHVSNIGNTVPPMLPLDEFVQIKPSWVITTQKIYLVKTIQMENHLIFTKSVGRIFLAICFHPSLIFNMQCMRCKAYGFICYILISMYALVIKSKSWLDQKFISFHIVRTPKIVNITLYYIYNSLT